MNDSLKEIINKSTYFSVRDKFSMEELINNGIDSKKIKLLNDLEEEKRRYAVKLKALRYNPHLNPNT